MIANTDPSSVSIAVIQFTAVAALLVGLLVLGGSPSRFTNQVFAAAVLLFVCNLLCIRRAIAAGQEYAVDGITLPLPWVRAAAAFGAFIPWLLVMLRESMHAPRQTFVQTLQRSSPWFLLAIIIAGLVTSDWYIRADSRPGNHKFGPTYNAVNGIIVGTYAHFIFQTWLRTRNQTGIRRMEMQFLALNAGVGGFVSVSLAIAGNLLGIYVLKTVGVLAVLTALMIGAWAICFHRIYNVREVAATLGQHLVVAAALAVASFGLFSALDTVLPHSAAMISAFGIGSLFAFWLDRQSRRLLGWGETRRVSLARAKVISSARSKADTATLRSEFEDLLRTEFGTTAAILLTKQGEFYSRDDLRLEKSSLAYRCVCETAWATPESLERRRHSLERDDLKDFLITHQLGAIVTIPADSATPNLIVALGIRPTEWPFTYPEIERLQNIAELMDNGLTHSRLTEQATLQAKIEHLAMMSRGLAHDLKNLITPVSSFLVYRDGKHAPESDEAAVHAAAQRSVRIMSDYVREALFFSECLAPRFEQVDLARIFTAVQEVAAERARARGVLLSSDCRFNEPVHVDIVLLQRMLTNLVTNAIDASAAGKSVRLSSEAHGSDRFCLQVIDEGCGIASEHLGRIFEPYFTTKEFGDDTRGFGLGLTISQKIASLHGGTIKIESTLGDGTRVTVELPRVQPASQALSAPNSVVTSVS